MVLCAACGPAPGGATATPSTPGPDRAQAAETAEAGGDWAACYAAFTPSGEPRTDIASLTRSCGPTGGMHAVTPVTIGEQGESDPVDRYTFYVPKAGSCYRVYAVGARGVADLDLLLRGPDGQDVVADVTHDAYPVLPPKGPICFDVPGLYLLEVSVFKGAGRYAVQVWGV